MTQRKLLTQNSLCVAQEANGGQRLALGVLFNHTALYLLSHSISQNPQLTHSASRQSGCPEGSPSLPSKCWDKKWAYTLSMFYEGCRAPNSGPLRCTAMILTTELTPQLPKQSLMYLYSTDTPPRLHREA